MGVPRRGWGGLPASIPVVIRPVLVAQLDESAPGKIALMRSMEAYDGLPVESVPANQPPKQGTESIITPPVSRNMRFSPSGRFLRPDPPNEPCILAGMLEIVVSSVRSIK